MRIAILTVDFPPDFVGGVSAWSSDLAKALSDAGHEVTVFAKHTGLTASHDAHLPFDVRRVRGRSWARWGALWMHLALGPRVHRFDWIICSTWPLARLITSHPRLAVAVHGSEVTRLRDAPAALRALTTHAYAWFPVSAFLARELKRLGLACREVQILPMPLALPSPAPVARGTHLICVARPSSRKGIDRAIKIARATGRRIELIGPTQGGEQIRAYGPLSRADTLQAVASAAAIVLTPRVDEDGLGAEGLGLCLIEAAGLGVPSIACRTGGVPEAAGFGLVLDDPDEPDGEAINAWLDGADRGRQARQWVLQNHGPELTLATLMRTMA